jgi:hypothetical protein
MLKHDNNSIDSGLNIFDFAGMDIFIAKNANLPSIRSDVLTFKSDVIRYLKHPTYNQIIEDNAIKRRLSNIGVLYAHGDIYGRNKIHNKRWVFDDSDQLHNVQDWIDAHDGKYSLLMLFCYAPLPDTVDVVSKKSSLLLPDDSYLKSQMPEQVQSRLYLPRIGLVKDDVDYQNKEISERA